MNVFVIGIMDYAVESFKKTSDIERKATLNKLHNMQWLKNTSHSANPEKIRAVVYKKEQDEDKKIKDKVLALSKTVKILLSEENNKYSSIEDNKTHSCDDTMLKNDDNVWNKSIDASNLFPNADKLADQKNEEDMLSFVESIVTAKLEAEFCINKKYENQSNASENNAEDITQIAVCTNSSDLQKIDGSTEELELIKHSDGNNNDSNSTPYISKDNDEQKTTKIIVVESNKAPTEVKGKDGHVKTSNITKTGVKAGSNVNLAKDNEKSSSPSNDSKKAASNSLKILSNVDKNIKDHCNNKQNNVKNSVRKQEFAKQRNTSRNAIEKEMKNVKPNFVKTGIEAADQSKNFNKDKVLQKQQQTPKQFALKSKDHRKNASTLNFSDDKTKTEKAIHTSENGDSSLNESEKKNDKIVNEKFFQSDQKANRADFRKNTAFVAQYKNSAFSKQNPRTGQAPTYGRNSFYAYNNSKFDSDRNIERKIMKKEHAPINTYTKSNTGTEEPDTSNLENCPKQKKEIIQSTNIKSTCEDTVLNDKQDINPVKVETHLTQSKEDTSSNHPEQGPTTSEQCQPKINDTSKVDIDQQHRETSNETGPFKHSSNLPFDKYTNSQVNKAHQYSLQLENMQCTNNANQLESSQATWSQSSDNVQEGAAILQSIQQSIQNMHFNTQHTYSQAGNARKISPWESNNSKLYDNSFSTVNDAIRLPQISSAFNVPPYEYNSLSNDSSMTTSSLETMINNRENSNVLYRYGSNVQQRPVMASDFPGHSMSPCQTNQARWNSPVHDGFHENPYVATQPTMMHVYNPAVFGPDDFNSTHMDYVSHPVIYAPSPYMQWNSQLQYPMPVLYNSLCPNYTTFSHSNQSNNFNNSMPDQQYNKHNPYAQMNYVRDTYNDTNTACVVQARNTADNVPIKSNYYYKKYQDNGHRAVYDVPQYGPPISYSSSQQGAAMNFVPAPGINHQYNAPYYPPNQKHYKQNVTNYMRNPKSQIQDFVCDDNGSDDIPPIISPTEFVTNDQFATRVFKPEFKTKSNSGYCPPSFPKSSFRRNTNYPDFSKEYTYPISIGRGTYKTKKT